MNICSIITTSTTTSESYKLHAIIYYNDDSALARLKINIWNSERIQMMSNIHLYAYMYSVY